MIVPVEGMSNFIPSFLCIKSVDYIFLKLFLCHIVVYFGLKYYVQYAHYNRRDPIFAGYFQEKKFSLCNICMTVWPQNTNDQLIHNILPG